MLKTQYQQLLENNYSNIPLNVNNSNGHHITNTNNEQSKNILFTLKK